MSPNSVCVRRSVAVYLGALLMGASSAFAADTIIQPNAGYAIEMLPASVDAKTASVEQTRLNDVDSSRIKRHLSESLEANSGLFPRNNSRYSFDGNMRMYMQVARPAIGSPFGNERVLVEFPKSRTVQGFLYDLLTN